MNMISTGAFLNGVDASDKQGALVKKLVAAWEKKNSKTARAGGVSLMALSLAACGSSDDDGAVSYTATQLAAEKLLSANAATEAAETAAATTAASLAVTTAAAKTAAVDAALKHTDGTIYASVDAAKTAGMNMSQADAIKVALTGSDGTVHDSVNAAVTSNDTSVTATANAAAEASLMSGSTFTTVAALQAAYNTAIAPVTGSTLALTSSADTSPALTSGNDTITSAAGTLNSGDVIIDTGGTDTLTAALTSITAVAPTIANVESINLNFDTFAAGTFDASNVVGGTVTVNQVKAGGSGNVTVNNLGASSTLSFGTGITGTATVDLAGGGAINAIDVTTLSVSDINSTGTTITFDNSTTTINLEDRNAATAETTSAATLIGTTTTGAVTTIVPDITADDIVENLTLQGNGAALSIDITDAQTTAANTIETITFTGDQSITVRASAAALAAEVSTDNTTGGTTMIRVDTSATSNLASLDVDVIDLMVDAAGAHTFTVANNATVRFSADVTNTSAKTFDAALASGDETLNLQLTASTSSNNVVVSDFEVLNINTSPVATDTAAKTISALIGTATTTDVFVSGSNNLTLSAVTADLIDASAMTGTLTVSTNANADNVIGGAGADTYTVAADGSMTFAGNAGNDTVNVTLAQTNTTHTVNGGAGTDNYIIGTAAAIGDRYTFTNMELISFDSNSTVDARDFHGLTLNVDGVTGRTGTDETLAFAMTNTTILNLANVTIDDDSIDVTITGNALADTITASNAADIINSGSGADTITAGGGIDIITGAASVDTIHLAEAVAATDTVIITTTDADVVSGFTVGATNGDQIDITLASYGAIINGDGVNTLATEAVSIETVASGGETAETGDNIFALSGDFASTAAVKAAIISTGTHAITLAGAATANDDILVLYDTGAKTFLATVNINNAATTIDNNASTTVANILEFSDIADATSFNIANFDFV
jgi:hypothetical protein